MSSEEWRSIPGIPGYEASSLGRIRTLGQRPGIRKTNLSPDGYERLTLRQGDRNVSWKVHRLVMAAFVGPLPVGHETRHLNGNKLDNRTANLQYGTRSENQRDNVLLGAHNMASKTHCKREHEFTDENTYVPASGVRVCRTCQRDRDREWKRIHRALVRADEGGAVA